MRSRVFDYSMKRLISIKEFKRKIEAEIQRVKNLTSPQSKNKWISRHERQPGELWEEDNVKHIPIVGKKQ